MSKIILYTTHCPRCSILEKKMTAANIKYEVEDNVDKMIAKGFTSAPMLEVDDKILNFSEAVKWLKEQE